MIKTDLNSNDESTPSWVLIDADGIDIFISKDDPWYNELTSKFPNYKEVASREEAGLEEEDFQPKVDYDTDEI